MLNEAQERELAYKVIVDEIKPIEGSDNCECAMVGGWHVMVKKGEFVAGDEAVYFEIDSLLPADNAAFEFMKNKKYRVKTQKFTFGGNGLFYSEGLIMRPEDLGITADDDKWLTKKLGVIYYEPEDNKRKASYNPYQSMQDRHRDLFKKPFIKKMMKYECGRRVLLALFGRKKSVWPSHIMSKTDVERIQNIPYALEDKKPYVATEKIDGTSCSIAVERVRFGKLKYYVCSRNVVFDSPNKQCFYDTNVYLETYEKYNFKEIIAKMIKDLGYKTLALQMEVYGDGIQKRDYSLAAGEHQAMIFHIVANGVKLPMDEVVALCDQYELPHVPIVSEAYTLPDTIEEVQQFVESSGSAIDGKPKEGIVFYDKETGQRYFKFVSPEFLMKYH